MPLSEVRRVIQDELRLCRELGYDEISTASRIADALSEAGLLDDGEAKDHP